MSYADKLLKKATTSNWDTTSTGKLQGTFNNCILFLESCPLKIAYNEFGSYIEIDGHRYEDNDAIIIKEMMRSKKIEPAIKIIDEAVTSIAIKNSYHPVRKYIEGLKWDGKNRVESFLSSVAGAEDNTYTRLMSTWLLVAPVYRVFMPGCQYDTMIILEGDQGIGKSKLVRALGGDWYKSIPLTDRDHNTIQLMQGAWFVEVAELSVFAKRDIESLKSFISNPSDFTRFAFIRNDKTFKRQSVFVGTINPESNGYLMDTTGNRRFLPVKLNNICPEKVPEIRDQLFAEAYQMFLRGVPIHVSNDEMISIISGEQKSREFHDDWSTIILNYININRFDTSNMMTACEIYEKALKGEIKHYDQRTARRIANIMRRLGCGDPVHTTLNGIGGKYFDVSSLITKDTHTGITQWTE